MHLSSIHTTILFPFLFSFFFFLISYLVFTFYFLFACVTISSQKVYACNLYFFLLVLVIGYYCTTNDFFYTHSSLPFYYFSFINSVCLLKFCTYLRVYFSHTFFPVVFHLFDILSIFLIHSWWILFFFSFFFFPYLLGWSFLRSFFFLTFLSFFGWNVIFFFFSESLKKKLFCSEAIVCPSYWAHKKEDIITVTVSSLPLVSNSPTSFLHLLSARYECQKQAPQLTRYQSWTATSFDSSL